MAIRTQSDLINKKDKGTATQAACVGNARGYNQNMGIHGSITGKMMARIICFDHTTTATTPLPNQ